MRVLFVYDVLSRYGGGSQIAVFTWLKNLKKLGIEIKLICQFRDIALQAGLSEDDIILTSTVDLHYIYPELALSIILSKQVKEKIRSFKPDIIHLHEPSLLLCQLIPFCRSLDIPVLVSFHTNYLLGSVSQFPLSLIWKREKGLSNRVLDFFQFTILKKSDYLTFPSLTIQKSVIKKVKKENFILPYPIKSWFFLKKNSRHSIPKKLLVVSRLSGEKNISLLIDMMQYLHGNFTLTVIGEGIDRKHLEDKTKKLDLDNAISFIGWVKQDQLPKYFQEHDVFLSASDFETFGITYIEALASRIPCIMYDYPVTREIIPEGTSIFVKSLDPKVWADQLIHLQEDKGRYQKLLQGIEQKYPQIQQYSEENSTRILIDIYKEIRDKANSSFS